MSDVNQNSNTEFETYPELQNSVIPDFVQMAQQKVQTLKQDGLKKSFDPYQAMLDKKKLDSGETVDTTLKSSWPEKDIQALEDFCRKYQIIGFNCGKMHPIAALAMLKKNLGVGDSLGENIPAGYEKLGKFGPNYPYLTAISEKTLLKG